MLKPSQADMVTLQRLREEESDTQALSPKVPEVQERTPDTRSAKNMPGKKVRTFIDVKLSKADTDNLQPRRNNPASRRSPLPKRCKRNEDPVGKHAKAAKVAAKKADKAAKVSEKKRKEVKAEAAKDTLAEVEADESFFQQQELRGRIRRQSDMVPGGSDDVSGSEEEFADLMDLVFSSETSETEGEPKTPEKKRGAAAATVGFRHLNDHLNKSHPLYSDKHEREKKGPAKLARSSCGKEKQSERPARSSDGWKEVRRI